MLYYQTTTSQTKIHELKTFCLFGWVFLFICLLLLLLFFLFFFVEIEFTALKIEIALSGQYRMLRKISRICPVSLKHQIA